MEPLRSVFTQARSLKVLMSFVPVLFVLKTTQVWVFGDTGGNKPEQISLFLYSLLRRLDDASFWVLVLATLSCIYCRLATRELPDIPRTRLECRKHLRIRYTLLSIFATAVYVAAVWQQKGTFFWGWSGYATGKEWYSGIWALQIVEGLINVVAFWLVYAFAFDALAILRLDQRDVSSLKRMTQTRLLYSASTTPALIFTILSLLKETFVAVTDEAPDWLPEIGYEMFAYTFILWYLPFFVLLVKTSKRMTSWELFPHVGLRLWNPARKSLTDWRDHSDSQDIAKSEGSVRPQAILKS